jgi:hypothetical protein
MDQIDAWTVPLLICALRWGGIEAQREYTLHLTGCAGWARTRLVSSPGCSECTVV